MTKLCVFDLDGTLLNTLPNIAGNLNATLAQMGYEVFPVERYCAFVGNGAKILVERALVAQDAYTPERHAAVYANFIARYEASPDEGTTVYDGMPETLAALRKEGVLLAVCTNKPHLAAEKSIFRFFGEDVFAAVCGAVDGVPLKPAPDGVNALLARFGIAKEDALFIGDSDVDMLTAKAAGLTALGALWGFRTREELLSAGADALLSHPSDLLSYVSQSKK